MIENSLISVIIPVYNGARYLADALNSVLAQEYRPLEIIVVDDGSTDQSAAIAQSYDTVRYAYQEHEGLGATLNHGVALATGDYFAFLDADDLWTQTKLTKQIACFCEDAEVEVVFGHVVQFVDGMLPDDEGVSEEGYFKGTMLIRRDAFFKVGLFDPQWRVGDFIDWYIRAREKNLKTIILDHLMLKRRVHNNNMSTRERDHRKAYLHILKQSLDRRQQQKP